MTEFQQEVLKAHGYRTGARCAQAKNPPELCPALSLPDLFRTGIPDQATIRTLLEAVPPYFSQAVISQDRKTANLAFGIRLMPLEQQKKVIDDINDAARPARRHPGRPHRAAGAGRRGQPRAVLAAAPRAHAACRARRRVPRAAVRRRRKARDAAVPLIPIALATGWSALLLFLLRIPLNPMSVSLGALVIAISTEFSVLLSARYAEERRAGSDPADALERTYALHRRGRARFRRHRHRRLRGPDRLRHPDAARLRRRDGGGPLRVAHRRDDRAARRAHLGGAARAVQAERPRSAQAACGRCAAAGRRGRDGRCG